MTHTTAIKLNQLSFGWKPHQPVLQIDTLTIPRGEQVFLRGASGSGKSTLLNLLGGLMKPQQGEIELLGQSLNTLSQRQRDRFRADHIGVLFQQFNLLPYLSLIDNVVLPCRFSAQRKRKAGDPVAAARGLLEALGLGALLIARYRPLSYR